MGKAGGRRGKDDMRPLYRPAIVGRSLVRVCDPELPTLTSEDDIRLAGWLSGFYDGEGSVSLVKANRRPRALITFTQGDGNNLPLCEKLESALDRFGFDWSVTKKDRSDRKPGSTSTHKMRSYFLKGQAVPLIQRFLHIVKPTKWRQRLIDASLGAKFCTGLEKVVSIEPDGEETVYGLTTTTGNYVVWGLASSNSGQYQQAPTPAGGGILKRDWWQVWDDDAALTHGVEPGKYPKFSFIVASLDSAYTEKETNDPSALTVWGVWQDRHGVLRLMLVSGWADHLDFPKLVDKVTVTCKTYRVSKILIEAKASGISVAQELRSRWITLARELGVNPKTQDRGDFGVQLVNPTGKGDKVARAHAVVPLFAAGLVYAPDKVWADKVIDQCAQFPKAPHDDYVDTVTQALSHLRTIGLAVLPDERQVSFDESVQHKARLLPLYEV